MSLTPREFLRFDLYKSDTEETMELLLLSMKVSSLNSYIVEIPSYPKLPRSILKNELLRAIGSTTAIEGNTLTEEEIQEAFEKADANTKLVRLEQEVQNSREAYLFIRDLVAQGEHVPMSVELIRQVHKITTKGIDHIANVPGKLRTGQVEFGHPPQPSLFPTEADVMEALQRFVSWCDTSDADLFTAIFSHYYLAEIHPFFDGNGRTVRAIEAFGFLSSGVLDPHLFFVLPNYCYRNRNEYLNSLRQVRMTGNLNGFLRFCLRGLVEELEGIKSRIKSKVTEVMFKDYVHYLFREKKKTPHNLTKRMVNLLELLVELRGLSLQDFFRSPLVRALYSSVSESTRSRDLKKLRENRLIVEETRGRETIIRPNLELMSSREYY